MGCGSSSEFSDDEPRTVVVFGATGQLGGSVARALLTDPLHFRVRAVTRRPSSEKARKLAEDGSAVFHVFVLKSRSTTNQQNDPCTQRRLRSDRSAFPVLSVLIQVDSEDSYQTGRMPMLI